MEARLKIRLSCTKGPPPDAVRMSSKLVDPEPVRDCVGDGPAQLQAAARSELSQCAFNGVHWQWPPYTGTADYARGTL